jgi:triacylglycerol lipase
MRATAVTRSTRRRRFVTVLAFIALVAALVPRPVAAATPDPVLLVHGFTGSPTSFSTMLQRLTAAGRTAAAIDLPSEDNIVNARAIRDFAAARGWTRFDIVGHSMGGLSSRYFVKSLGGTVSVDAYVSLGTPQYGINSACLLPTNYGGQMCPSRTFIRNLNTGDDTPPATHYTTLYSTSDSYVPATSSRLDGGACHVQVSGVSHSGLLTNEGVHNATLAALDRICVGTFK